MTTRERRFSLSAGYAMPCPDCENDERFTVVCEQVAETTFEEYVRCGCGHRMTDDAVECTNDSLTAEEITAAFNHTWGRLPRSCRRSQRRTAGVPQ